MIHKSIASRYRCNDQIRSFWLAYNSGDPSCSELRPTRSCPWSITQTRRRAWARSKRKSHVAGFHGSHDPSCNWISLLPWVVKPIQCYVSGNGFTGLPFATVLNWVGWTKPLTHRLKCLLLVGPLRTHTTGQQTRAGPQQLRVIWVGIKDRVNA